MFDKSILTGSEVKYLLDHVDTFNIERESGGDLHIGPSSIDLHVAPELCYYEGCRTVNVADEETYPETTSYKQDPLIIEPGNFYLARTDEHIELPNEYMGIMHGRSSIGRLGLFVENAGLVDRGFEGTLTLELYNPTNNRIKIPAQTRLCQIAILKHSKVAGEMGSYDGKYVGQKDATPSRAYKDD